METEKRYPYATVELTERCNLRCKHCYFFKDKRGRLEDLPDQEIITRLAELQQRYGIKAMSWAGGEMPHGRIFFPISISCRGSIYRTLTHWA